MLHENMSYPDHQYPLFCHQDVLPRSKNFQAHWHENYELLHMTGGEMELILDGEHFTARPGQIVVINSGVLHCLRAVSEVCTYDCLLADTDFLMSRGIRPAGACFQEVVRDAEMSRLMRTIVWENARREPLYRVAVLAAIDQLFVCLCRRWLKRGEESHADNPTYAGVKKAMRYIHAHYAQPLTLDEICREAGFAKNYFCRIFSEYAGQPPIRYLNRVRCEDARRLLRHGQCSVSEAAQRCGFPSASYFSQYYRKLTGHSPSADIQRGE